MPATADQFRWLLDGEVGSSSMTIWHVMTGERMRRGWTPHYPLDPADLRRCLLLLDLFPEWRGRLGEVAAVYPEWSGIVAEWPALEGMLRAEMKETPGIAVNTYRRMQAIEDSTARASGAPRRKP